MKNYTYLIISLCLTVSLSSCSYGKKMFQSPEDYVRERYGMPWQTEEEYEVFCENNRQFEGVTVLTKLQEWAKFYRDEDAFFEQKAKDYHRLYNNIEELAMGIMYNRGNDEEAFKALLVKAGYGNEAQCKVLIEGLKKDGFLTQELARMRQAHKERIMSGITPLCKNLGEADIAFQIEGNVEPDHVKRVFITAKPRKGETQPGECPYWFYLNASQNKNDERFCLARIGGKNIHMYKREKGMLSSEILTFKDLALFTSGEILTVICQNY